MNAQAHDMHPQGIPSVTEVFATPLIYPIPLVERDGAHFVFYEVGEDGSKNEVYDIPVSGVQDASGVAFWMRQIAQKRWLTARHVYLLACAIHALHEAS